MCSAADQIFHGLSRMNQDQTDYSENHTDNLRGTRVNSCGVRLTIHSIFSTLDHYSRGEFMGMNNGNSKSHLGSRMWKDVVIISPLRGDSQFGQTFPSNTFQKPNIDENKFHILSLKL